MAELRFSSKKVNYQVFMEEFQRHAEEGYIGDPRGEDSWGYLRVSTDGQTKEEKNGVPRQIENLHNAALRDHVRISWDDLFGDDESGYITERPALQELLKRSAQTARVKHLTFESIGRMSREWEWQQGWLLHQFEDLRGMTVHFFDEAGSPLERMFKGYMYGESMKMQKKLMADGRKRKARNGFVPTTRPAFGFRIGAKPGYDPKKIKEFTYWYAKKPDPNSENGCTAYGEAKIVVEIFEALAYDGLTTYMVCEQLEEKYGPPGNYVHWAPAFINDIVHNTAYYGQFAANRHEFKIVESLAPDGKTVVRKRVHRERPQEEWQFVEVEPIVTKELWDLANRALVQNKKMCSRNKRVHDSLLTGLLRCAYCGYAWGAENLVTTVKGVTYRRYYYGCQSTRGKNKFQEVDCPSQHYVRQEIVDAIVWDAVKNVMFHPEILLELIDRQTETDANRQVKDQIAYIENQIARRELTDKGDRELFDGGFMALSEYGPKHKETVAQIQRWQASIEDLKRKLITAEDVEAKKQRILYLSDKAKRYEHLGAETPIDLKRNLIKMCVDVVYIDEPAGQVRIVGEIGDYTRNLDEYDVRDNRNGGSGPTNGGTIVPGYGGSGSATRSGNNGDVNVSACRYVYNSIPFSLVYSLETQLPVQFAIGDDAVVEGPDREKKKIRINRSVAAD